MNTRQPTWFKVNNTFKYLNGWYIGTSTGVNLGPYEDQNATALRSKEISNQLANTAPSERIALIRRLLLDEWENSNPSSRAHASSSKTTVRRGERSKSWFRADRFYSEDDAWFFSTREGVDVGPYETHEIAQREAQRLIKMVAATPNPVAAALLIHEFNRRPLCAGSATKSPPALTSIE